jgi:hypothetical protein
MKTLNTTQRQLAREFGIYIKRPKLKDSYLTRNGKFLAWLPVSIELTDDGHVIGYDGWNRAIELV